MKEINAEKLYTITHAHNVSALCWHYFAKDNCELTPDLKKKFEKDYGLTIYTCTKQTSDFEEISRLFNENTIYFLPLKGIVVRSFYYFPVLRYSCDIDILIRSQDISKAKSILKNNGWSTNGVRNFHDIHFYKANTHLELHYNICENMPNIDRVLADVWANATVKKNYELTLNNEFFFFHQIAHAYYHFMHGGCGIKAVIDVKVLKNALSLDMEKVNIYLDLTGIRQFYDDIVALIGYWFENQMPDSRQLLMEKYIIAGGAYGSKANLKLLEALSYRIVESKTDFLLPKNVMCAYYPAVDKYHCLLPLFYIKRWGKVGGHKLHKYLVKQNILH